MNSNLEKALKELKTANAEKMPIPRHVEAAKDGTSWSGTTAKGEAWSLTKNNPDSYNCEC